MTLTVSDSALQAALPSYEIGGELGRGAMGVVVAARHRQLERDVAIKQLPPAFASDDDVRQRFGQEARTLASLAHAHIVPVYDFVDREGLCLLVMEALPGGTLWDRFTSEGVTIATACTVVLATCAGLEHAHSKGVLHRDVKPENLMFAEDQTLKVTDFGIAQVFGGEETVTTVAGAVIGTPAYMAPEQAQGKPCGPPADVYATATVLYELLSGSSPFSLEGEAIDILERRVHEDPVPLTDAASHVPEPLVTVTMRALRRDPDDRYPSAESFGVAVGEAATESFGPGWLGRSDLTLFAAGPIAIAAGPSTPASTSSDAVSSADVSSRTGRETTIAGKGEPIPHDMPSRVRGTAVHRPTGARLDELTPDDFVRVDDLIRPPKAPWVSVALASVLLIGLLVISAIGLGSPRLSHPLRAPGVLVAGVDISSGHTVHADLAHNVPVRVRRLPAEARRARYVRLGFSVLGVQLPDSRSALLVRARHGGYSALVDAQRVRILFAGHVTGEVRFLDASKHQLVAHDFHMNIEHPFYLVATGLLGLLLLAFVLSYAWSLSQPLRRGHRRGYVGVGVAGAVAGATVIDLGWAIVGPQPTVWSGVAGIVLGTLVAVLTAHAVLVLGRRSRLSRARARSEEQAEPAAAEAA